MSLIRGVQLVTLMLLPSALLAVVLNLPRIMAAVEQRLAERRRQRFGPWTYAPPIEQIAADLRRLLARHSQLLVTNEPLRVHRLRAVELAIASCVDDAERALGLADPGAAATRRELRARLRRLADAGFVLPASTPLLADDVG